MFKQFFMTKISKILYYFANKIYLYFKFTYTNKHKKEVDKISFIYKSTVHA